MQYLALECLAAKTAAACRIKRLPAIKSDLRPVNAKQAFIHEERPGVNEMPATQIAATRNPLGPKTEVLQYGMHHNPNPYVRLTADDFNGGLWGSRAGFQDTHNFPNLLPGASM